MDKLSKKDVSYENPAKGMNHCSQCTHYTGGKCDIVSGSIAPGAWCESFNAEAHTPASPSSDFFTTLYNPTNELTPPRVPDGSRISKALAAELNVHQEKPSIAND